MAEKQTNKVDELQELKLENEKLAKEVWKSIADAQKSIKDNSEELKKYFKELGERIDKTNEAAKQIRIALTETNKAINGIANSNGMFAEETIYNALAKEMAFGGTKFDDIFRNMKLHKKSLNLKGEFDVVLENYFLHITITKFY